MNINYSITLPETLQWHTKIPEERSETIALNKQRKYQLLTYSKSTKVWFDENHKKTQPPIAWAILPEPRAKITEEKETT